MKWLKKSIRADAFSFLLHITLAILQAFDDQTNIPFFQGIHHAATIPLDAENSFQAHILQMVGRQRLLATQHLTDFGNRQFGMLFQQMDNTEAQRVSNGFKNKSDALQLLCFLLV